MHIRETNIYNLFSVVNQIEVPEIGTNNDLMALVLANEIIHNQYHNKLNKMKEEYEVRIARLNREKLDIAKRSC